MRMSNYPCSLVHGGGDPVGKSVLYFLNFIFYLPARLLQLGVSETVQQKFSLCGEHDHRV